jgi:uracil-DNA glycosylase
MEELTRMIETCERCPRLREYCAGIAATKVRRYKDQDYWGRPVPGFGDPGAKLLLLGLAPGAHGANRTGRMFTGDDSGKWLYGALHQFGFANRPESVWRDDGLELTGAYVTAAGRCAPPDNKPTPAELEACRPYLEQELALLDQVKVVLVLGKIAFDTYLKVRRAQGFDLGKPTFAHLAEYRFADPRLPVLLCSYHPSRQNTQTGKLTWPMWEAVFARARGLVE